MLDLFRQRGLTSVVYGGIVLSMVVVFVIQFNPSGGKKLAAFKQTCAATVRNWCVDPKDHMAAYRILMPRDRSGVPQPARARSMGLRRIALDGLVERELLVGEAERLGLTVTDQEVTDSIFDGFIYVSVPADNPQLAASMGTDQGRIYAGFKDQKSKQFDMKVYVRTIRALMGRSETEFREEQTREILAAKMRNLVRSPIRVSELEAWDDFARAQSSATLSYVPVKTAFAKAYAVPTTPAAIDAWAAEKANADAIAAEIKTRHEQDTPKAGHNRHILVKVEKTASTDAKAKALAKLTAAVERVKAGELFAEVAREVSEDSGSAAQGGDLGDKTDGFVAPFKKAADGLKAGESTRDAIETQFGFHVIAKDDPAKTDIDAALKKAVARDLYLRAKADEAAKAIATKIREGLAAKKSGDEAVAAGLSGLPRVDARTLKLISVLPEETAPTGDAGADDASATVKPSFPTEGTMPTALSDHDKPDLRTSSSVNRGGDPIPDLGAEETSKVVSFAFGAKDGDTYPDVLKTDDGYVVVVLKEHKAATKDEFEKNKDVAIQALLSTKQAEALTLYVKRLREGSKAVIQIDESFAKEPDKDAGAGSPFEEDEGM
ncbi:MAG: peptidylprolyl isomerase [Polyangiaceae bacterium]